MRSIAVASVLALVAVGHASAHVPATAIGQAVQALRAVPVSYSNGAAVSDLEADAFGRLPGVGEGIFVAAMPGSALREIAGGPDVVAAEIAREAALHGTLIVLAGRQLGAWSDEIPAARVRILVHRATRAAGGDAARVAALAASIQAEPKTARPGDGLPWGVIVVALLLVGGLGALAFVLGRRARARASSPTP